MYSFCLSEKFGRIVFGEEKMIYRCRDSVSRTLVSSSLDIKNMAAQTLFVPIRQIFDTLA